MNLFISNRELLAPVEHGGVERAAGTRVMKNGEIITKLIGVIRAVHT